MTIQDYVEEIRTAIAEGNTERVIEILIETNQDQHDAIIAFDEFRILHDISDNLIEESNVAYNFEIFKRLFNAASDGRREEMLTLDNYGIFHSAVTGRCFPFVKFLIDEVNPNAVENMIGHSIVKAAEYGEDEIMDLILEHTSVASLNAAIESNNYDALIQASSNYGATALFLDTIRNAGHLSEAINSQDGKAMSYAASSGENSVVKLYIEAAKELDRNVTQPTEFIETNLGRILTAENCRAFRYAAQNNHADVLETLFAEVTPQIARSWIRTRWSDGGYHAAATNNNSEAVNVMILQFMTPEEDRETLMRLNCEAAMPKKSRIFLGVVSEDFSQYFNGSSMLIDCVEAIEGLQKLRDLIAARLKPAQGQEKAMAKSNKVIQELLQGNNLKETKRSAESINMKRATLVDDVANEIFLSSLGNFRQDDNARITDHREIFSGFSQADLVSISSVCLDFFGKTKVEEIIAARNKSPSEEKPATTVETNDVDKLSELEETISDQEGRPTIQSKTSSGRV